MSRRATVTIYTEEDRAKVARWAQQTNVGTVVEFRKKSRSTEQNSKLWAMLTEVSEQVVWYGQKLDSEDWKTIFTASLRKANVLPGIDAGTVVPLGISTSTMTIDEMGNLIELIYAFGAHQDPPVVFKYPKPETDDAPASGADEITSPETEDAAVDHKATAAASSNHTDWLLNVTRMLWAATNFRGDIDLLKNQKAAAREAYPKPEDCPALISGKAEAVYGYCKQIVDGALEKEDGKAIVAGVALCDQDDLEIKP